MHPARLTPRSFKVSDTALQYLAAAVGCPAGTPFGRRTTRFCAVIPVLILSLALPLVSDTRRVSDTDFLFNALRTEPPTESGLEEDLLRTLGANRDRVDSEGSFVVVYDFGEDHRMGDAIKSMSRGIQTELDRLLQVFPWLSRVEIQKAKKGKGPSFRFDEGTGTLTISLSATTPSDAKGQMRKLFEEARGSKVRPPEKKVKAEGKMRVETLVVDSIEDFVPTAFENLYQDLWGKLGNLSLDAKILELGVGQGDTVRFFTREQRQTLVGLDREQSLLAGLKRKYPEIKTLLCDWRGIEAEDGSFDACLGTNALNNVGDVDELTQVLKEMDRVLRPVNGQRRILHVIYTTPVGSPAQYYWGYMQDREAGFKNFSQALIGYLQALGYHAQITYREVRVVKPISEMNQQQRSVLSLATQGQRPNAIFFGVEGRPFVDYLPDVPEGHFAEIVGCKLLEATKDTPTTPRGGLEEGRSESRDQKLEVGVEQGRGGTSARGVPAVGLSSRLLGQPGPEAPQKKPLYTQTTSQFPSRVVTPPLTLNDQSKSYQDQIKNQPDKESLYSETLAQDTAQHKPPKHRVASVDGNLQKGVTLLRGKRPSHQVSISKSTTSSITDQGSAATHVAPRGAGLEEQLSPAMQVIQAFLTRRAQDYRNLDPTVRSFKRGRALNLTIKAPVMGQGQTQRLVAADELHLSVEEQKSATFDVVLKLAEHGENLVSVARASGLSVENAKLRISQMLDLPEPTMALTSWLRLKQAATPSTPSPRRTGLEESSTLGLPHARHLLPGYDALVNEILAAIERGRKAKRGHRFHVGIMGIMASGKTQLADHLASRLRTDGDSVIRLNEDALGVVDRTTREAWERDGDPRWSDWEAWVRWDRIRDVFRLISTTTSGPIILDQLYVRRTGRTDGAESLTLTLEDVVIYDGVVLADTEKYPDGTFDLLVVLDATLGESVRRQFPRDQEQAQRDPQEVETLWRTVYLPHWERHVARWHPEQKADLAYDMTDLAHPVRLVFEWPGGVPPAPRGTGLEERRAVIDALARFDAAFPVAQFPALARDPRLVLAHALFGQPEPVAPEALAGFALDVAAFTYDWAEFTETVIHEATRPQDFPRGRYVVDTLEIAQPHEFAEQVQDMREPLGRYAYGLLTRVTGDLLTVLRAVTTARRALGFWTGVVVTPDGSPQLTLTGSDGQKPPGYPDEALLAAPPDQLVHHAAYDPATQTFTLVLDGSLRGAGLEEKDVAQIGALAAAAAREVAYQGQGKPLVIVDAHVLEDPTTLSLIAQLQSDRTFNEALIVFGVQAENVPALALYLKRLSSIATFQKLEEKLRSLSPTSVSFLGETTRAGSIRQLVKSVLRRDLEVLPWSIRSLFILLGIPEGTAVELANQLAVGLEEEKLLGAGA